MPTYEYECVACHHEFEEFQQISDGTLRTCPKCKKRKLQRKIGMGGAVIFKGSGFYQTDYRSTKYKEQAKSESAASTPSCATAAKDNPKCASCPNAKKDAK